MSYQCVLCVCVVCVCACVCVRVCACVCVSYKLLKMILTSQKCQMKLKRRFLKDRTGESTFLLR